MNKKQSIGLIITAVIIVAAFIGIMSNNSKSKTDQTSTATSQSNTSPTSANAVQIKEYMFGPMQLKVKVGTKVTWTNLDAVGHTVTADTPTNDAPNSQSFGQNETFSFTFKKAGTYSYHCNPHPFMHGTVVVTE